jgi:hypothetical protein
VRRLLVLLVMLPALASAQPAPSVSARWEGAALRVEWSGPGCLYLVGGGKGDALVEQGGQNFCHTSGSILLPTGGVDAAYAPQLRTHVVLRENGTDLARAIIPPRTMILPLIYSP